MEEFTTLTAEEDSIDLPPGFRFHPTDEEIITHYLIKKATNNMFIARAIGDVDLNKCEPWDLPKRAKMGETQWYFFCQRDRKYPTGMRTNRATQAGYWKATGKDKEIYKGKGNLIGMKKTLVFYKGRAPKGEKTNWVMHEYRLEGDSSLYNLPKPTKEEWSVCRVFHKNIGTKRDSNPSQQRLSSHSDGYMGSSSTLSLPPLVEPPAATNMIRTSFSFPDKGEIFKETSSSLENVPFGLYGINYTGIQESQQGLKNQPTVSNHYQAIPLNSFQRSTLSTNVPFSSRVVSLHQGPDIQGYLNQNRNNVNLSFQNNESSFGHQEMMRELGSASWVSTSKNQCKVEQFSNQSGMVTVSQDTGLSDIYTDNSSVISKPEPSHGEFDGLSVNTSSNDSMFDWLWPYGINVED